MEPFFFKSVKGHLFGNYFPPSKEVAPLGDLIFCPPFAEELNRSRHMIARQARSLAGQGYGVLLLDLFGTGDSEGTYGETAWDTWLADLGAAVAWVNAQGRPFAGLWAKRTGALLAADFIGKTKTPCPLILLWQPVTNGKNFVGQFLRIKLAGEFTGGIGPQALTSKDLTEALGRGETLEIAGYDLTPDIANSMGELSLAKLTLPAETRVKWIEISLKEDPEIGPGSRKVLEKWTADGVTCESLAVKDIQFWTLQEPEWADGFSEATRKLMKGAADD
ncbi:hydrolase 2, exosortase A system-associated [Emcibacter nanhaiensis]|uniref:Hydrolase 2, exosortase A system-associated n=1 Tax=Emcibacter nanhaiensis TaxID=1505037 RepID=A0A501PBH8_9PROT|nr:hydrolase 2, exosortase A system-associated [Emcibacter nanhaiensis]TPD57336.1 hydrolase 2, exosortase A system-associated [Emcibacter nanhaiensis]